LDLRLVVLSLEIQKKWIFIGMLSALRLHSRKNLTMLLWNLWAALCTVYARSLTFFFDIVPHLI
jgi:hypothetical protein